MLNVSIVLIGLHLPGGKNKDVKETRGEMNERYLVVPRLFGTDGHIVPYPKLATSTPLNGSQNGSADDQPVLQHYVVELELSSDHSMSRFGLTPLVRLLSSQTRVQWSGEDNAVGVAPRCLYIARLVSETDGSYDVAGPGSVVSLCDGMVSIKLGI